VPRSILIGLNRLEKGAARDQVSWYADSARPLADRVARAFAAPAPSQERMLTEDACND